MRTITTQFVVVHIYISVTFSWKTSLMLGVHKAGFRREGIDSILGCHSDKDTSVFLACPERFQT